MNAAANETAATPAETVIDGRTYQVTNTGSADRYPLVRADLIARGWDGETYLLTGRRGAAWLAYRSAATGAFEMVSNMR